VRSVLLLAALPGSIWAQKFEIASVKVAAPLTRADNVIGERTGGPGTASPERISWRATILRPLLEIAYGVKRIQIVAPLWVTDFEEGFGNGGATFYDIAATMAPGTTTQQMGAMMRNLLEDRFAIKVHREQRDLPAYTLSVAKGGPKLVRATQGDIELPTYASLEKGGILVQAKRVRLSQLVPMIEFMLREEGALVVDHSALDGDFDIDIRFASVGLESADSGLPTIFAALEKDLGLKLEKGKARAEVVVVDSVNKVPTSN
jgi:uncharacterized protein (TIGR03435 family)